MRSLHFLEVNTRIQVKHCISEEITRADIVALQIYVAAGGRLGDGSALSAITLRGHAIECRLCAESPENDFLLALGMIRQWKPALEILPAHQTRNVRFESGFRAGTTISKFFDSMIAKIVVRAPSRVAAVERMLFILKNTVCIGPLSITQQASFPKTFGTLLQNRFVEIVSKIQQSLSILPALFIRQIAENESAASSHPFRSLRNFRNQTADRSNTSSVIIRMSSSETAVIVTWAYKRGVRDPRVCHAAVRSMPDPSPIGFSGRKQETAETKIGAEIARDYSTTVSSTLASANPEFHQLRLLKYTLQRISPPFDVVSQASGCLVCDMTVEIDDKRKLDVYFVTDSALSPSRVDVVELMAVSRLSRRFSSTAALSA
ncbi:uncharacterized protein PAC_18944 [Phialocephala subalpina]|uniref:Biotin carboxylation domain-containing protein n=1 Tax=Phialocephala subalpina TaxID=576137 RepID=A0A1L7XVI3_9HELO|nr:uncharacterized protein PAC_18944 [Phialocephala subalpina]